ncbi:hypothetical protein [uncultured Phenylobacterium sp.]|uniref:hypothetical protein n=1 Tax=uncultured Phenylobacterium sp. TaxID=349273 RepID=UPI0025FCF9A7|nr:hypothetical protein [uncultured Phenylobacterium sp.]
MWRTSMIAAALLLNGCASAGEGAKTEVNAVVQDEGARQAAAVTAAQGAGSKAALEAGEAAAKPETASPQP